ncbi:DUF1405 domain-containing protein, partial [Staphylococcus pseudintermedius]|uniref:DUF1405 domain-containing protein n=1 Tax=Staphylococcus pseudintermedius TaxID=283734 RepID=UPI001E2FA8C1
SRYMMGVLVICSHVSMASQSVLCVPHFHFTLTSIALTIYRVCHHDVIDYVFNQYPVYGGLGHYAARIGYLAYW